MTVTQTIRLSMRLLNIRDRRLLVLAVGIQMGSALLDLVGVLLIGLVGALSVAAVQSLPPPSWIQQATSLLGLSGMSTQSLVMALAACAAVVLLLKSVMSSYLTRRVLVFLANRQALVSARLCRELLSRPLTFVQRRSSQHTAYALIGGAGAATSLILGQAVIAATEVAVLVLLGVALLLVSPWIALGAVVFFLSIAWLLQRLMGSWATRIGGIAATADIASLNAIQEALDAYREVTVTNRRSLVIGRIQDLRWQAAKVAADLQLVSMLPKYIFEAALVVGGFVLTAVLFATRDAVEAVGTLALFLAAASRVIPSLLRLQSAMLGLRSAAGAAEPTFELAAELEYPETDPDTVPSSSELRSRISAGHVDFSPHVKLETVSFTYPEATKPALAGVSLNVRPGDSVAIVGRSGAGKSTLADIIIGAVAPDAGMVSIGGLSPAAAVERWPGGVAYVPQAVSLSNTTIRRNVALGLPDEAIDDKLIWEALERAHIADYVRSRPEGLDTTVGERGALLSGGQRQRLGIARALFTRPKLLVLDEATSALDAETEADISRTVSDLNGKVTTIVIAHRLSTVRHAGLVVYLEDGHIRAQGTFESVSSNIPAFARQAQLMGLTRQDD